MYRKENILDFLMWCINEDRIIFTDCSDSLDINTTDDLAIKVTKDFMEAVNPLNPPKKQVGAFTNIGSMSISDKYDYLIGMIEGCMECDNDVMATERLLDSFLIDLQYSHPSVGVTKDSVISFIPCNERPSQNK